MSYPQIRPVAPRAVGKRYIGPQACVHGIAALNRHFRKTSTIHMAYYHYSSIKYIT